MLFKYSVKEVPNKGRGVVAEEFIPKGAKIWAFPENRALVFRSEEQLYQYLATQPPDEHRSIVEHIFCSGIEAILLQDDTQFTNHDDNANTFNSPDCKENFAKEDIHPGDEITDNYTEFNTLDWFVQVCQRHGTVPGEQFPALLRAKQQTPQL